MMKRQIMGCLLLFGIVMTFAWPGAAGAEQFRIAIMQDQSGAAQKFIPMHDYLSKKGVDAKFIAAPDYPAAAGMFSIGAVDGMFSSSGVAGFLILKDFAVPTVRPIDKNGRSTYWTVVLAKKGSPKFTESAYYFTGKKVVFASLSSSGDFYFHSLPDTGYAKAAEIKVASHGAAIETLNSGKADIAIVKNRVWDSVKDKYPNLEKIGEDKGENPDGTLIVSKTIQPVLAAKVANALLGLKDDSSLEAMEVKKSLGIQGYIKTTLKDFEHTLSLLRKADVDKRFNVTP